MKSDKYYEDDIIELLNLDNVNTSFTGFQIGGRYIVKHDTLDDSDVVCVYMGKDESVLRKDQVILYKTTLKNQFKKLFNR